jgi:hypothetical protein
MVGVLRHVVILAFPLPFDGEKRAENFRRDVLEYCVTANVDSATFTDMLHSFLGWGYERASYRTVKLARCGT